MGFELMSSGSICVCVYVSIRVFVIVSNPLLNGALMGLYQAALLLSSLEGCGFVFSWSLAEIHTHSHTHSHTSAEATASAQCVTRVVKMWDFPVC